MPGKNGQLTIILIMQGPILLLAKFSSVLCGIHFLDVEITLNPQSFRLRPRSPDFTGSQPVIQLLRPQKLPVSGKCLS